MSLKVLLGLTKKPMDERDHKQDFFGPVISLQSVWEFTELLKLYKGRKPKRVLELGTAYGGTLYHFLQNSEPGTRVVSIDSYTESKWYGPKDNREFYEGWCPEGVSVFALEGRTNNADVVRVAREFGPYDWIFIDAGHAYEEVSSDWHLYSPMVTRDAVIAFHDIAGDHPGVVKLWQEIRQQGYLVQELVSTDTPYVRDGLGIGIVYMASR